MQENLPVERLVRKALRAEEPIGRPGIRQLGIPQGAKRLEERKDHWLQGVPSNLVYANNFVKLKLFKAAQPPAIQ
ncbi:MAG: hypothetical protein KAU41_03565 [Deltaproteobacteria bacterium]|nr:hypothetical protein [Deltaproteobacteria bacterium]